MTAAERNALKSLATQIKTEMRKDDIKLSDYDVDTQKRLIIAYVVPAMETIHKITDKLLTNASARRAMTAAVYEALTA